MADSKVSPEITEILRIVRSHDLKFSSIENQLSVLDVKVKGVEKRLDDVNGRLRTIDERLDLIEQRLSTIERYSDPNHADLPKTIPANRRAARITA